MDNFFKVTWKKIQDIYKRLETRQKIVLASLLIMTISTLFWLLSWSSQEEYGLLFGNMDAKEAQKAIDKLDELSIKYKLENGGRSISIPEKDVYRTRIALTSEGIGSSAGVGFELFDKSTLGMTEFIQNINLQRAMEGELRRTIEAIEGIDYARIHLVFPEDKLFKEDQIEASASIMLVVKNKLKEKQIQGIANFVASAVEGLTQENVSIIDQQGNVLTDNYDDSLSGLSNHQLKLQHQVEQTLTNKVQAMLNQTYGARNSVVTVSAELNFENVQTTLEKFDPQSKVVRSEEIETSSSTNETDDISSSDEHLITNYEINKTVQQITNQVGNIKRLTVSVIVNYKKEITNTAEGIVENYIPRSDEEIGQIEATVRNAVGYNDERNDQIVVSNVLFEETMEETKTRLEQEAVSKRKQLLDMVEKGGVLLVLLILVFVLMSQFRKIFVTDKTEEEEFAPIRPMLAQGTPESEGFYQEGEEGLPMGEGKISFAFSPMKDIEIKQTQDVAMQELVKKFIIENPDIAVKLVKTWIAEKR
ncbi:MAG: flagellar basal-body MS-ring/collar protein FliF [Candidatus Cloacimonetes bacterium]|nr:flagellar basal-body MS-ring/collar protein FliF [Candidatus Cloacimonadota bacterium]